MAPQRTVRAAARYHCHLVSERLSMTDAAVWDHTQWGTWRDPIHKSDLNGIVGKFGCTEQFRRKKDARASHAPKVYEKAGGKLICGNAVHAVIARVLRSPSARAALYTEGFQFKRVSLETAFREEYNRERKGREVEWYKVNADKWIEDQISILEGVFADFRNHVAEVLLVEAGFIYSIDGVWVTGMTDLVYRPVSDPTSVALADWKTGATKPHPIELDHGWEAGIYSGAIHGGYFIPGETVAEEEGREHRDSVESVCIDLAGSIVNEDAEKFASLSAAHSVRQFNEFPKEIRHVHLRDLIPYAKKSKRLLTRPEEIAWAGLTRSDTVHFEKGDKRGPAWLHVRRKETDLPRLRHLLHAVVQWVRMGLFVAAPGELCTRCQFREPCLNTGYGLTGEEADALSAALDSLEDGGGYDE